MVTAAMKLKDTCSLEKSYGKSRQHIKNITLLTNVHLVKAMVFPLLVFPVIMHGCESWTIKKADKDHMKTIKKGEELMFLNCGVGEDSSESLGLQGDQTSQSSRKSVLKNHWKD